MSCCTHMILVSSSVHKVSVSCVCIHIIVLICVYNVVSQSVYILVLASLMLRSTFSSILS